MVGRSWLVASLIGLMPAPGYSLGQERKPAAPDLERAKEQIVAATNEFRKQEKRRELKVNAELSKAAQGFAEFMARTDKYGHEADGKTPAERVTDAGYAYCIVAENIAYQFSSAGFTTADLAKGFIQGWKDSPPHRKNMLDPDIDDIGVGLARSEKSGKYYAVQNFGRPKSKEIKVQITNRTDDTVKYTTGGRVLFHQAPVHRHAPPVPAVGPASPAARGQERRRGAARRRRRPLRSAEGQFGNLQGGEGIAPPIDCHFGCTALTLPSSS